MNSGDFPKSILNVGGFRRQFKSRYYIINAGDPPLILGKWNVWPDIFKSIFHTVRKIFIIFRNAFMIFT